jgi:hypothetical protein
MKRGALKLFLVSLVGGVCYAGMCLFSCGPTNPKTTDPFANFIITNQISGWALKDSVRHFVETTLFDIVNGGNIGYCGDCTGNSNLKAGIYSTLENTQNSTSVNIFVMDYKTTANAKTQYDSVVVSPRIFYIPQDTIPTYPVSVAVGAGAGSIYALAHFGKYYFELQFVGYSVTSEAVADAKMFLDYFQPKTN